MKDSIVKTAGFANSIVNFIIGFIKFLTTKPWIPTPLLLMIFSVFLTMKGYEADGLGIKIFIFAAFLVLSLEVSKAIENAMSGNKNTIDNSMAFLVAIAIVIGISIAAVSDNVMLKNIFLTFPMYIVFFVNILDFLLANLAQTRIQRRDYNVNSAGD